MSYSLNEIEALCKKAARGAGYSWGMAEEAGKAARWLASYDLAGPEHLAALLAQNDGLPLADFAPQNLSKVLAAYSGPICPLAGGAALCDSADQLATPGGTEMSKVMHPMLVIPFAASASVYLKRSVALYWDNVKIHISASGIRVTGSRTDMEVSLTDALRCEVSDEPALDFQTPSYRGDVSLAAWTALSAFAHRTYAPATEESRILGAGAGVADND